MYLSLIEWFKSAKAIRIIDDEDESLNIEINKSQHQIVRICSINKVLLDTMTSKKPGVSIYWDNNYYDTKFHEFLKEQAGLKYIDDD